jgi:hypothetical protein
VFVLDDDHSVGFFFIKVNKTTIVVISAHARLISDVPILLLGLVFACYGPSAFYLTVDLFGKILVYTALFFKKKH